LRFTLASYIGTTFTCAAQRYGTIVSSRRATPVSKAEDVREGVYDTLLLESYGLTSAEITALTPSERVEVVVCFETAVEAIRTDVRTRLRRRK
jgi:hypothetical protein